MRSGQGPTYLALSAVWAYWLGVLVMAVRTRIKGAVSAGLVPRQTIERIMWIVWIPVISGWILIPWLSITQSDAAWQLPLPALENPLWLGLRWLAAFATLACLGATIFCWRWMGRNWRVGVATDEQTDLITGGPFSRSRHPIYAISMLMMICTLVAVPVWPLLVVAVLHVMLMNVKAHNEERWMSKLHGRSYAEYRKRTGRFFPAPGG